MQDPDPKPTYSPKNVQSNGVTTVLVVDDDPYVVEAIKVILEKGGEYEVVVARSEAECLHRVATEPPDLILLDMWMPGMNGIHVLEELRSDPANQDIPVLIVSVDAQIEQMAACFESGANGFIIKPFDASSLYRQVRNAVNRRRAALMARPVA